jgi:urease accessory protein UreE
MAKKLSAQTVTATAKTLKKAAQTLSSDEEKALRMRTGVGLQRGDRLEAKTTDAAIAEKIAQIELMAFKAMGAKVYGIGRATAKAAPGLARSPKDKIIKALNKR